MSEPPVPEWNAGLAPAAPRRGRRASATPAPPATVAQEITLTVPPEVLQRLESIESLVEKLRDEVRDLRDAQDVEGVRSSLDLVADRLGTLLGGPSMTELLDRIDELERRVLGQADPPPKRRRRL